jgi:hypothetical protein
MITCEITSGGVTMAAKTKIRRMAYFLCLANILASITPILARSRRTTGNSKTRPKTNKNLMLKERYSFMLGMGLMRSVAYPKRNLKPIGRATWYPKKMPNAKKKEPSKTKGEQRETQE